ncbi:MAG: MBL fold metallo-hydrolase [Gammaproteobacteria bacterium]|nr:MBL fold metallo-hydrolase [Gammaproteobacteria bacterium]
MPLFPRLSAAACLILFPVAVAAADRGDRLEDFDRTVTEKPFEITVDQRACAPEGVHVQVLGSGGPGLDDGSASSGYLVWVDGRARVLIDTGPGTALNFEKSGADFKDLVAVAYTHLHPDHSSDLPAFVQGSENVGRTEDLPLYGPAGNDLVPGLNDWIDRIIGPNGSWPLLSDYLSSLSSGGYELVPDQMDASGRGSANAYRRDGISLTAIPTDHGRVPALAGGWTWKASASPSPAIPRTGARPWPGWRRVRRSWWPTTRCPRACAAPTANATCRRPRSAGSPNRRT